MGVYVSTVETGRASSLGRETPLKVYGNLKSINYFFTVLCYYREMSAWHKHETRETYFFSIKISRNKFVIRKSSLFVFVILVTLRYLIPCTNAKVKSSFFSEQRFDSKRKGIKLKRNVFQPYVRILLITK